MLLAVGILARVAANDTASTLKIDVWHVSQGRSRSDEGERLTVDADTAVVVGRRVHGHDFHQWVTVLTRVKHRGRRPVCVTHAR